MKIMRLNKCWKKKMCAHNCNDDTYTLRVKRTSCGKCSVAKSNFQYFYLSAWHSVTDMRSSAITKQKEKQQKIRKERGLDSSMIPTSKTLWIG